MCGALYDALVKGGVPADDARKAAEEVAELRDTTRPLPSPGLFGLLLLAYGLGLMGFGAWLVSAVR